MFLFSASVYICRVHSQNLVSMSNQFEFENAIREATRMDTSLSKAALSKPRKALENTNTSLNISVGEF